MVDWRTIPAQLGQGVDSKSDPKQITVGKMVALENATFVSPGRLKKRNGYQALSTNILGGGTLGSLANLFSRGSELLIGDTSLNLYSYSSSLTAWDKKGVMPSVTASTVSLGSTQYNARNTDMAYGNGLICSVFELYDQNATSSAAKGIAYSIVDAATGNLIVAPTVFAASATSTGPRVVYLGTNFVFFWLETDFSTTATLYATTVSSTAPLTSPGAKTAISSGSTTSAPTLTGAQMQIDAKVSQDNTSAYVAFTNRSNTATIFRVLAASPTTVTNTKTGALGAGTSYISYALVPDSNGDIVLAGVIATEMDYAVYSADLSTTVVAAVAADTGQDHIACVTGVATAAGIVSFFYSGAASSDVRKQYIRFFTTSSNYGATTPKKLIGSVSLGGQAFKLTLPGGSAKAWCPIWFSTTGINGVDTQATAFVIDTSGNIYGGGLKGTAGCFAAAGLGNTSAAGPAAGYLVGSTMAISTYVAGLSQAVSERTIGSQFPGLTGSALAYQYAPVALEFNFADSTNGFLKAELGNCLHTSGSVPYLYDGANCVEENFLQYPWDILGVAGAGGSLTSGGVYGWQVTYEWMDAQGQIHRSAPGAIVGGQASIGANTKVTLTIPTLRCTAKTGVLITVWRTTNAGSVYYQVNNFNASGTLYNDKTVDTVTWVDTLADTSITGNPQLYTTGGVLANYPPTGANAMVVHRSRLFEVDPVTGQLQFSNKVVQPTPVQFSPFNTIAYDQQGGQVTALGSMDDKLILFRQNRISYVLGDGPDSTGGQFDYLELPIVSDTGCAVQNSIVAMPDGLMFYSPKGYYLLDRGLSLHYIGADVEQFNTNAVRGATLSPSLNQVRFVDSGGRILVYDYYAKQWSSFTFANSVQPFSSIMLGGSYYIVDRVSSAVWQETAGVFSDPSSAYISMKAQTGWISLAGLQGFQRLKRVLLLGDFVSAHTLTATLAFDYGSVSQTDAFNVSSAPANSPYQWRLNCVQQKCEAVQITVFDQNLSGAGEGFNLSGMEFYVGAKKGPFKLPAAQAGG